MCVCVSVCLFICLDANMCSLVTLDSHRNVLD